jgi:general secretion pathway protein G
MMMLSIGAATDKANAAKIVSNLRNLKAAAVMYYADNDKWPENVDFDGTTITSYDKYMDRQPAKGFSYVSADGVLNVACKATNVNMTSGVMDKLGKSAADSGLYSTTSGTTIYTGSGPVYMRIR